jgi:hypothetical protein
MWSRLLQSCVSCCYDCIVNLSIRLVVLSCALTWAYQQGYLHRFVWYLAEAECTKLVNHVHVTFGSIDRLDLLRGEFELSNIVFHSPNHSTTILWSSPVIARIGKAKVSVNAIQCLCSKWFLGEELPLDLYVIAVADIQVFVERRYNVYNFFLLDPNIILPAAFCRANETNRNTSASTTKGTTLFQQQQQQQPLEERGSTGNEEKQPEHGNGDIIINNNKNKDDDSTTRSTKARIAPATTSDSSSMTTEQQQHHETTTHQQQHTDAAAAIVDDMLDAVKRAAQAGSADTLVSHYKDRLQESLKRFETTKTTTALVQTVELLKNVGANITHKTELAQQAVLPTRRPNPKTVYGRIGRLDITDMRIFPHNHPEAPIYVHSLSMKPSELCGPSSTSSSYSSVENGPNGGKPPHHHHPFARMEDLMELVTKRIVSEMAKSDSGKFLQTAMQEMADALTERS